MLEGPGALPGFKCCYFFSVTAKKVARSSRSNVLYLRSRGEREREKNEIGCQLFLTCCCKTAPTAVFDASTMRLMGALG